MTGETLASLATHAFISIVTCAFVYGRLTERVKANTDKLDDHDTELKNLEAADARHGERISTIEGRLSPLAMKARV
jgi:hypothetical protein